MLYSALAAPAERLYITYARQNIAGDTALAPSGCLLRVLRPLQVTPTKTESLPAEFWVVNKATAKGRYAAALGKTGRRRRCWPPFWSGWERGTIRRR